MGIYHKLGSLISFATAVMGTDPVLIINIKALEELDIQPRL